MCVGLLLSTTVILTGCTPPGVGINGVPPMTLEEVAGRKFLVNTEEEKATQIYNYISDRVVVDKGRLLKVEGDDASNVHKVLQKITGVLQGAESSILEDATANYLLMEFAKTPFEWQQSSVTIQGFDPASRLYFVDVVYSTTGNVKSVIPDSKIPLGAPDSAELQQKRYMDYIGVLGSKYNGGVSWQGQLQAFEKRWGKVTEIQHEQQGTSILERTRGKKNYSGGIGGFTYAGIVDDSSVCQPAKMTVRYVMKYNLNLGEEQDMGVVALYVKDYVVGDVEETLLRHTNDTAVPIEVLSPFIDRLIRNYDRAVEESNAIGLWKMYRDYGKIDKYYEDMINTMYYTSGGYKYKILGRKGSDIYVQVDRVAQYRARGSNMSLPTYEEVVLYKLELGQEDEIKIKGVYTLSSKLVGEPLSVVRDVSGISDSIQYMNTTFTLENKEKVEEVLKQFCVSTFEGRLDTEVIDLGVSHVVLTRMGDIITAIDGDTKVVYLVNWDTKTNVYCSVKIREVYQTASGNHDTEAVVDLVNRGGVWKVVNYTRILSIRGGAKELDTDKAFVFVEKEKNKEVEK